jgi:hypothetical protein
MKGVYQRGTRWWIDYTVDGRRFQEPTKAETQRDAARLRAERMTKRNAGELQGHPERVQFAVYATERMRSSI